MGSEGRNERRELCVGSTACVHCTAAPVRAAQQPAADGFEGICRKWLRGIHLWDHVSNWKFFRNYKLVRLNLLFYYYDSLDMCIYQTNVHSASYNSMKVSFSLELDAVCVNT